MRDIPFRLGVVARRLTWEVALGDAAILRDFFLSWQKETPQTPKRKPLFVATWGALRPHGDDMAGEAAVLDWPHIALLVLGGCG